MSDQTKIPRQHRKKNWFEMHFRRHPFAFIMSLIIVLIALVCLIFGDSQQMTRLAYASIILVSLFWMNSRDKR